MSSASKLFYPLCFFLAETLAILLVPPVAAAESRSVGDVLPESPQEVEINPVGDFGVEQTTYPTRHHAVDPRWDEWHKRVAAWINARFQKQALQSFKAAPPLRCKVSYMVSRDGRVGSVRVLSSSGNALYDRMLLSIVRSLAHQPVLLFPPDSNREFVEKTASFDWNCNAGRRYCRISKPGLAPGKTTK
ncbi:MAG: energy transducer TonB [Cyanobacteria bacterium SZAS TMP-1]|nr:energy transducer TonB [Cyanobacteria bacterium SZAS TMP-1]